MLKRNLIANFLGQGWGALMSLAFIPVFIRYLGMEAYGLIGLYAVLQSCLSILDMGMAPTLLREMARFTGGQHNTKSIHDLLRSVEIIAVGITIVIGVIAWISSNWIAREWLRSNTLPISTVSHAFAIMGIVTALRIPEGIYRSSLLGLQRQTLFNILNGLMSTVRWVGAIVVLATISASIQAFFIWQVIASLVTVAVFSIATYHCLPATTRNGRFSLDSLKDVRSFATGIFGTSLLVLLLTQVDKIILSKILPLQEYGYYTLASVVAGGLYLLVSPIIQAWSPRLSELHARGDIDGMTKAYHLGAQIVSVLMGSAAIVLIVFTEPILFIWTHDHELAQRSTQLVRLIAIGNLLNGLMWIPYQTQLAYGWTSLAIKINMVSVALIVPGILWASPRFGALGAAWAWVFLNAGYVLVGIHFMHSRILPNEKRHWYFNDCILPLLGSLTAAMLVNTLSGTSEPWKLTLLISIGIATTLLISSMLAPLVRAQIFSAISKLAAKPTI